MKRALEGEVEMPAEKKARRDQEQKELHERWAKMDEEENAARKKHTAEVKALEAPWLTALLVHTASDTAGLIMEYMLDCIHCLPASITYPVDPRPILLLFYADHNTDPFLKFMNNIVADGDKKPLAKVLMKPLKKLFPKVRLRHFLCHDGDLGYNEENPDDEDDDAFDTAQKVFFRAGKLNGHRIRHANEEEHGRHLMVDFKLNGQRYVACETRSRQAYRWVHDTFCEKSTRTRMPERDKCKHSVVLGYYVRKNHLALCNDLPIKPEDWGPRKNHLHPGCWLDVLQCMQLPKAPDTLWHALSWD